MGKVWPWLVVGAVALQGPLLGEALRPTARPVDFFQEWASAREVLAGRPAYPDLDEATPRLLGVPADPWPTRVRVNAHPPAAILAALPFGGLRYGPALAAWRLMSAAAVLGSAALIVGARGARPRAGPLLAAAVVLATSGPVAGALYQGQWSAPLLAILVVAWWSLRTGRSTLAGGLIGVAACLKVFPAFLLLHLALRGRWRALAAGVVAVAVVQSATAAILGPGVFAEYGRGMGRVAVFRAGWANASLPGLAAKLFDPGMSTGLRTLYPSRALALVGSTVGVALVILAYAWATIRLGPSAEAEDRGFGLALTSMLLLGPLTWEHSLVLMLLPITLLWRAPGVSAVLKAATTFGLWVMPMTWTSAWLLLAGDFRAAPTLGPLATLTVVSAPLYALLAAFGLQLAQPPGGRAPRPAARAGPDRTAPAAAGR